MGACSAVNSHLSLATSWKGGSSADTLQIRARCEAIPEDIVSALPRSLLVPLGLNFT